MSDGTRAMATNCLRTLLFASLTVTVVACSRADEPRAQWARVGRLCAPWSASPSLPVALHDSLPRLAPGDTTGNPHWQGAQSARRLPGGWGGEFIEGGRSTMYLTEPDRAPELTSALGLPPGAVHVRRARWDYAQLYDWYRYLVPHTQGLAVAGHGIDVAGNRIEFLVVSSEGQERLEERLRGLGVPCRLVAIRVLQGYPSLE